MNNLPLKPLLLVCFALTMSACAHLRSGGNNKSQENNSSVEVRDLPFEARGENEAPRHRILILPFLDERVDGNASVSEVARQTVVRDLLKTRNFVIVSLDDFPQDPKKFINEEGDYDLAQIAKLASSLGASAVLEGKIMNIRANRLNDSVGLIRESKAAVSTQVRLRLHAGRNGKEILNELRSADVEASSTRFAERDNGSSASLSEDPQLVRAAIRKAFAGAIPNVVRAMEKLSWEGRVAMVSGERIFINAGHLSGLQVGDVLKVTDEGEDIYDPDTGRFIGTAPGRLKGTVEVVSYFGKDGAIAVIHSGSGFQENDRVELY